MRVWKNIRMMIGLERFVDMFYQLRNLYQKLFSYILCILGDGLLGKEVGIYLIPILIICFGK